MNGDILSDIDYTQLMQDHIASDAVATIATHQRSVQISLGILRFGDPVEDDKLTGYIEKPTLDYECSMGIYCFDPAVLPYIEPGVKLDFPDLILRLIANGETVRAWRSDAYWLDIGRHDDYEQAQDEFDRMRHRLIPGEAEQPSTPA
jgi:NDP-sugar pyrophosphorylase family protein